MKKYSMVAALWALTALAAVAQSVHLSGKKMTGGISALEETFYDFGVYKVNIDRLSDELKSAGGAVELYLDFGSEHGWRLTLQPTQVRSPGYRLRVGTPSGTVEAPVHPVYTFRGHLPDGGYAALTVAKEFLYGFINTPGRQYFIEPASHFDAGVQQGAVVVYEAADVRPGSEMSCAATDLAQHGNGLPPGVSTRANMCQLTEIAIASDYLLFQSLGSVAAVESRNVGIMNNVAVYYRHEFEDNIEFSIVEQYVASSSPDPWTTSTSASDLLNDFTSWAPTGFSAAHDVASLWTARDFDGATVGLAWVNAVCSSSRYNVLQDLSSAWQDNVLQTHELGHNFGAGHDASGSPYIMAPSLTNTDDWSAASVTSINGALGGFSCLSSCPGAPTADFLAEPQVACAGESIQFKDKSVNGATRSWSFPGGSPASSTAQQPTVTYTSAGDYDVTLTSTGNGSHTLTKTNFIHIDAPTSTSCTPSGGSAGITFFGLSAINNSSGTAAYTDFSCSSLTVLEPSTTYGASITIDCGSSTYKGIRIYIDYNNDGDFTDPDELVATSNSSWCGGPVTSSDDPGLAFTTIASPVQGQILKLRVIADQPFPPNNPCLALAVGEAEDYGVYFEGASLPVELIDFRGKNAGSGIDLFWETAAEINNSHFIVQRSPDGAAFHDIGKVAARPDPGSFNAYSFTDEKPYSG
ncbi:MAG TPA: PKD domain-containing protein, partial [Bacteroidetes bacterium]|nr:PKD domain-containing protein [Bacteroidota bacterium]